MITANHNPQPRERPSSRPNQLRSVNSIRYGSGIRPDQRTAPEELLRHAQTSMAKRNQNRICLADNTGRKDIQTGVPILREMEALVAHEAQACGATLSYSEALQDARHGLMLKWSANARSDELRARLDKYTFHHEQVDNSPVNSPTRDLRSPSIDNGPGESSIRRAQFTVKALPTLRRGAFLREISVISPWQGLPVRPLTASPSAGRFEDMRGRGRPAPSRLPQPQQVG